MAIRRYMFNRPVEVKTYSLRDSSGREGFRRHLRLASFHKRDVLDVLRQGQERVESLAAAYASYNMGEGELPEHVSLAEILAFDRLLDISPTVRMIYDGTSVATSTSTPEPPLDPSGTPFQIHHFGWSASRTRRHNAVSVVAHL